MKHLIASIALVVLGYLAFAFVQAELNPFKWHHDIRAGLIATYVLFGYIINFILFMREDVNQKPKNY